MIHEEPGLYLPPRQFDELRALTNRFANALAAHGGGAATASASCCRNGRRRRSRISRPTSSARCCSRSSRPGRAGAPIAAQRRDGAGHRHRERCQGCRTCRRPADLARSSWFDARGPHLDFWAELEMCVRPLHSPTPAATSRRGNLHLWHHRQAEVGALHGHRVLLGHIPGVQFPQDLFPQPGDLFWTWRTGHGAADYSTRRCRTLHSGVPGRASRAQRPPASHCIARHNVRNSFLPPTAPETRQVARPRERHGYAMRSIGSGGEALGEDIIDWARGTFDLAVNEFYGHEANLIGNCNAVYPSVRARWDAQFPAIASRWSGPTARNCRAARRASSPCAGPIRTHARLLARPRCLITPATGCSPAISACRTRTDISGLHGRDDDLISSGAYRIGPTDIEDCIIPLTPVLLVAVVGSPDPVRAARWSRRSSSPVPMPSRARRWRRRSRRWCASASPPTSIRGRSSSSPNCLSPPLGMLNRARSTAPASGNNATGLHYYRIRQVRSGSR